MMQFFFNRPLALVVIGAILIITGALLKIIWKLDADALLFTGFMLELIALVRFVLILHSGQLGQQFRP